jgi:hypothetical protein
MKFENVEKAPKARHYVSCTLEVPMTLKNMLRLVI